jgi:hypothetical protein
MDERLKELAENAAENAELAVAKVEDAGFGIGHDNPPFYLQLSIAQSLAVIALATARVMVVVDQAIKDAPWNEESHGD